MDRLDSPDGTPPQERSAYPSRYCRKWYRAPTVDAPTLNNVGKMRAACLYILTLFASQG